MSVNLKSIFWRIMSAFIIIIVLTVIISTAVDFYSTRSELPVLLTDIRSKSMAQVLGSAYARDKSWAQLQQAVNRIKNLGMINLSGDHSIRIIVRDADGATLYNSFTDLTEKSDTPLIEGNSLPILDYETFESVGSITLYISEEYLGYETKEYLLELLFPRLVQGLLTIILAVAAAVLLSRHFSAPITALTEAACRIADGADSKLLPETGPGELGDMSRSFNAMVGSLNVQRELRKRLLNDVSHELANPLNVIRLDAKGLSDNLISPQKAAGRIIEEVDTLNNLVQDLNWLAETDSGEFRLKLEQCSVVRLVREEVQRWQPQAEVLELTLRMPPVVDEIPDMQVDAARFSRVMGNLIENGLKYTPPGGEVNIVCSRRAEGVMITVCDTGTGIAAKDLPHIFERLYRGDPARMRNTGGRGLGLAIVKQIIELHGGRVSVESESGRGTCFRITLPRE